MTLSFEEQSPTGDSEAVVDRAIKIANVDLIRWAGLAALAAGVCYVLVGIFHPPNAVASVTSTRWAVVHVLACAMCFFGVLGLAGLYARQAERSGWLGFVGYIALNIWLMLIMGFSFVEAFILPRVATAQPAFVQSWMAMFNGGASKMNLAALPTVWTLSGFVYILGGLLFGIATFRAGVLPRGAGVLLALGTTLSPVAALLPRASQPKVAIPVGLALAWLGYALWSDRRSSALPNGATL